MREEIKIEDFHIGFIYEELQLDSSRYFNRGQIWVVKRYGFKSPRLHKIKTLIEDGLIRHHIPEQEKERGVSIIKKRNFSERLADFLIKLIERILIN